MKRPQILAAAASSTSSEAATMSSRPPYRGGRNQWRRGFSDRTAGDGHVVTGDSHFDSVRDANLGFRPNETPNFPNQSLFRPNFNPRPTLNPMRPPPFHQHHRFRPPHLHQNQRFRPPQQIHVRPQKPLDYRNWEFAKQGPLPHCERFTVLSYNILADYLAINHRSKLYFHIPWHMLEWEWRKRNIIHELGLWSSDILCFQEVDRFHDLEEELKRRGYNGFWKMRTGDPVDGCAIFWRVSRFKLLHEECIEFNKLRLRDNVAQICVLESLHKKDNKHVSALPLSLTGSNKVVICNIHVLYNPKRGDIKVGQIRVLLDRAHAVSKLWDDAPVVLCGDFNCTPKSPLYNYISDQKLNLSDLPRDKLSGQTSAEIHPPRHFSLNFRAQAVDSTGGVSAGIDNRELKQSGSLFDVQEQNNSESNSVNLPMNNLSQAKCVNTKLNVYDNHSVSGQCGNKNDTSSDEMTRETHQDVDDCKDKNHLSLPAPDGGLKESPSSFGNKGTFFAVDSHHEDVYSNLIEIRLPKKTHQDSVDCQKDEFHSTVSVSGLKESGTSPQNGGVSGAQRKDGFDFTPVDYCHEDIHSYLKETEHEDKLYATIDTQHNSSSEQSQPNLPTENELMSCDKSKHSFLGANNSTDGIIDPTPLVASNSYISSSEPFHETSFSSILKNSTMGSSGNFSFDDEKDIPSILSKDNISCELTSIDCMIDEKVENELPKELVENNERESISEGSAEFLSELHGKQGSFSSNFNHSERFDAVPHRQQLHHPKNEMDNDSPGMDSVSVDALNFTYNPSAWTPMEIETATGNADCTHIEHPLRLRSTYTEVEDHSGTRDSNGEPLVTSYNRCFSGTVDYIWRSEGLQTVRVLAPMPKLAMQWTPGFPTKKWGSDHIALVTELAFVRDVSVRNTEAP